jgi:hypothetical protein
MAALTSVMALRGLSVSVLSPHLGLGAVICSAMVKAFLWSGLHAWRTEHHYR